MTDRTIVVRLRADTSDYTGNIVKASNETKKATQSMSGWVTKNSQSISQVSTSVGIVGAAMTGVAVLAVSKFAQFDAAMSHVAATGDDAKGSLDALRQAALDAGADTVFSATEAAAAVENLAKAGVSAQDILGGGLAGSLDLAAAGSLEVADAAEIAATAMTQFNLEGSDMTHVADLLAAGAGKAQGDVSDMAGALKQSGLVASQFGLSIEETVGTLTAFASAGLLGSDAGTSFRTMLLRMGNPSKEAAALMEELGIAAYDAQGNFVGMSSLAEQLKTKLDPLTQANRDSALATIFGSDAIRAANVLMTEGAAGIDQWTAKVDDQGFAAEVAATKLDNLQGDLEKLSGAFETALIGMGEGGDAPLRSLVQGATEAVDAFGRMPDAAQNATLALVGGGGLVLLGIAGLGKMVVAINEVRTALVAMNMSTKLASVAGSLGMIAGYGVGIGATAVATGMLVTTLTGGDVALGANELEKAVRGLAETGDLSEINAQFDNFGDFLGVGITNVTNFGEAVDKVLNDDFNSKTTRAFEWIPGVQSNIEVVEDRFTSLDQTLATMVSGGNADKAAAAFATMTEEAEKQGYSVEELQELFPQYADALVGAENAAEDTAEAQAELEAETAVTTTAVEDQTAALLEMVEAASKAAGNALSLYGAQTNLEAAYDAATEALKTNGATLDVTTEAGRANRDALANIASSGWDVVDSLAATGATQEELQTSLQGTREQFVLAAEAMGLNTDEANALADELGLIPQNIPVSVPVTSTGLTAAQANLDAFVRNNNGKVINLWYKTGLAPGSGTVLAPGHADGGPVTGPGGPRSDAIPAMLSAGEYVINAAAVNHYGPRFMANINARRYADGGEVGGWSAPPAPGPAGYAAQATMVTMNGARLTGSLDLGGGLVGVIDARVAQGMATAARAQAATRTTTGRVR